MNVDTTTIDRIVANVLGQLGAPGIGATVPASPPAKADKQHAAAKATQRISDRVITADTLDAVPCDAAVSVPEKAIITPAARDVAKERNIHLVRDVVGDSGTGTSLTPRSSTFSAYIIRHTETLTKVLEDQLPNSRRELLGCPDDAAKLAISDICRGDAAMVLIFAEQAHRAACLANRNEKVKAVIVRDIGDVKHVLKQLRANVWCVDPDGLSYFELRNLLREIVPLAVVT